MIREVIRNHWKNLILNKLKKKFFFQVLFFELEKNLQSDKEIDKNISKLILKQFFLDL